jgi:ankyrin repeat protein
MDKDSLSRLYHGSLGEIRAWVEKAAPDLNEDIFVDLRPLMMVADRFDPEASEQARRENRAIYEYLISKGANPDPWSCARVGDIERLDAILTKDSSMLDFTTGSGDILLTGAAKSGSLACLSLLLSLRLDANATDASGATALMYAAGQGREDMIEKLLDFAAEINASDDRGMTPLRFAELRGHGEIVEFLMEKGALN